QDRHRWVEAVLFRALPRRRPEPLAVGFLPYPRRQRRRRRRGLEGFAVRCLHPSRRGQAAAPQDEVLNPHGEERGNAARLEPRGHRPSRLDSTQADAPISALILSRPVPTLPKNTTA